MSGLQEEDEADEDEPGPSRVRLKQSQRLSSSVGEVLMSDERAASSLEGVGLRSQASARSAESTRSLTYLEWVHERQLQRMLSRSEWFVRCPPALTAQVPVASSASEEREEL